MHVVLLGDSIFDNASYVAGGPDVTAQLREVLPDWRVTRQAVDGSMVADIKRQAGWLGSDVTHLVLSVGGNDALDHVGMLSEPASSFIEVLDRLAMILTEFLRSYEMMVQELVKLGRPVAICTIYDGRFEDALQRRAANAALTIFNDAITRVAFAHGTTLIDLRLVCDQDDDLANPIEPSVKGGAKIARAIGHFCQSAAADPEAAISYVIRR